MPEPPDDEPGARRRDLPANVGRFFAFRVLFNARFYYPVLAVLFVDLGLTIEQYTLLNVAWAVSIVVFELPLGALGDQVGYKPLVVAAAVVMVVEMSVLAFFRSDSATLLFAVFLVNRVLSGLAEAAASGADEALAYDSLVDEGLEDRWPQVLGRLGRRTSAAMAAAMIAGGAVYDPALMSRLLGALGMERDLTQQDTVRLPIYLTLALAVGALLVALRMTEPRASGERGAATARETLRGLLHAARWVIGTGYLLALVSFHFLIDSVVRLVLTLASTWFRLLGIAAVWFGVLGAAFSAVGFFTPPLAERLVRRTTPRVGFGVISLLALLGLAGVGWIESTWGVLAMFVLAVAMHLLQFLQSHYLNVATPSKRRATVLSFKSLAGNLAYGFAGWAFALALRVLAAGDPPPSGSDRELELFGRGLSWLPLAFLLAVLPLIAWSSRLPAMRGERFERPAD
ncbi:MAG TPA: MFS transporter [Thermoanaerobaculia bacterium]|nr:MFS transporter [Thermoanaerobaculia bacterium]